MSDLKNWRVTGPDGFDFIARDDQAERRESGPVQFGNDWPGVFIRGDEAMGYAESLRAALYQSAAGAIHREHLFGLIDLLLSAEVKHGRVTIEEG